MLIGIDASRAAKDNRSGTENYSYYLIKYLAKIDQENDYILYTQRNLPSQLLESLGPNFKVKKVFGRTLWSQWYLARQAKKDKLGVFFVPSHVLPFLYGQKKSVVTIHGLEYKQAKNQYSLSQRLYLELTTWWAQKKAKMLIVPSEASKNELIKFEKTPTDKIKVIPHGIVAKEIARELKHQSSNRAIHKTPYLFFIGRLEARKNIFLIVESFLKYKQEHPHDGLQLVLAGNSTDEFAAFRKKVIKPSLFFKDVIELGYVSDEESLGIMSNADGFIFPSLSEGFGLPLLDAAYAQVPIITSNSPPMNEIAPPGSYLVDPNSVDSVVASIAKLRKNEDKSSREGRNKKIEKLYSWEKTAQKTLQVLEKVASQKE
ncbi:glycosyltransferase family 4 protein [Patescibacteria group bacterium]|nr:glycosyltransferase family 4 protein [Patescibacteria group bacterium]